MDNNTERGTSPGIGKALDLRNEQEGAMARMRKLGVDLGGPIDPRVAIEERLAQSLTSRTPMEPAQVQQTLAGQELLKRLADEVGHTLPQAAPAVELAPPAVETPSNPVTSLLRTVRNIFSK